MNNSITWVRLVIWGWFCVQNFNCQYVSRKLMGLGCAVLNACLALSISPFSSLSPSTLFSFLHISLFCPFLSISLSVSLPLYLHHRLSVCLFPSLLPHLYLSVSIYLSVSVVCVSVRCLLHASKDIEFTVYSNCSWLRGVRCRVEESVRRWRHWTCQQTSWPCWPPARWLRFETSSDWNWTTTRSSESSTACSSWRRRYRICTSAATIWPRYVTSRTSLGYNGDAA